MQVTVLHCPGSKFGPYHLVYDLALWPAGSVRNRGWASAARVYERRATAAEVIEVAGATRYLCWRYRSWEDLRADEAKFGIDADACRIAWKGEIIGPQTVGTGL